MSLYLNFSSKHRVAYNSVSLITQQPTAIKKTDQVSNSLFITIVTEQVAVPHSEKTIKKQLFSVYSKKTKLMLLEKIRKWKKQPSLLFSKKRPDFSNYTPYNLPDTPPLLKPFRDKKEMTMAINKAEKKREERFNPYLVNIHSFNKRFK